MRTPQAGGLRSGTTLAQVALVTRRHIRNLACLLLLVSLTPMHGAAAQDTVAPRANDPVAYRLNPSDVLDLDFRFTPEMNQSVTVRPDGFIALHGADDVQAAGLTLSELTRAIERAYGTLLRTPMISVSLKDFKKPYVVVDGEVDRPGQYELRGNMTLTEALAVAGGMKDSAKHSEVWVFHRLPSGKVDSRRIDVKRMQARGDLRDDLHIDPSDVIFVPKSTWSKVQRFIPIPGIGWGFTLRSNNTPTPCSGTCP